MRKLRLESAKPIHGDEVLPGIYRGFDRSTQRFNFDLDLGFDSWRIQGFRLAGQPEKFIDTPRQFSELYGASVIVHFCTKNSVDAWFVGSSGLLKNFSDLAEWPAMHERMGSESEALSRLYWYRATVEYSYDADTTTATIYQPLGGRLVGQKIRYYGIDAPELRGNERSQGLIAKGALLSIVPDGSDIFLQVLPEEDPRLRIDRPKRCKFGRWLGIVWTVGADGMPAVNVNQWLIERGYAVGRD